MESIRQIQVRGRQEIAQYIVSLFDPTNSKNLLMTPTRLPPSPRSASPPPSDKKFESDTQKCLWFDCTLAFPDPEALYNHLCNDHIGRKSTNNLCLTCKWKDCGTACAKRDHITSHLRGKFPFDRSRRRPLNPLGSPHPSQATCVRG